MDQKVLIEAAEQIISSHIWKAMLVFVIIFIMGGLIKATATMIFEYILIKTDLFGVGSIIYYSGKKCEILNIGMRRTKLKVLSTKEVKFVRTGDWRKFELVLSECNDAQNE